MLPVSSVVDLATVEITTGDQPTAAVVWLHGLGADGHDFEPIVPYLEIDPGLGVRFVFPHAPKRAVTINMGLIMPAWYDVRALDLRRDEDVEGILDSDQPGVPAGAVFKPIAPRLASASSRAPISASSAATAGS